MEATNEGELERMREHLARAKKLPQDLGHQSPSWDLWVDEARQHLERLLELAEADLAATGGSFAEKLRQALEQRIITELRGQAVLTNDTKAESLSLHVLPGGVVVDVRLRIGRWQQG